MVYRPRKISNIKSLFGNLAQTSHYQVRFGGIPVGLTNYLVRRGISRRFIGEDAGLLCNTAVLPTTQIATADINGNYIGITESFAYSRQYQDISLTFYVDSNYNTLKFLEHWMEFISSGSSNPPPGNPLGPIPQNADVGYFIRMQYPEDYKSNRTTIIKFDRDYKKELEYTFIGLYPYSIASMPVSYDQSNILTMQVNFKIDRYVIGKATSYAIATNTNNNLRPLIPRQSTPTEPRKLLIPRSPGSIPSNGVELVPANQSLYEYLYGPKK